MQIESTPRKRRKRLKSNFLREILLLPNLLTLGRMFTLPLILVFMDNYSASRSFVATLIYLGGAISDFVDGWIARRWKLVSVLGKFLDPLADKVMVTSVLIFLVAMDRCPAWVVVVLLCRELTVTGLRSIAASEGFVISASDQGKQKTALQMVATLFLLLHFRYPLWGLENVTLWGTQVAIDFHAVGIATLYLSMAVSILSAVEYFWGFARALTPPPST